MSERVILKRLPKGRFHDIFSFVISSLFSSCGTVSIMIKTLSANEINFMSLHHELAVCFALTARPDVGVLMLLKKPTCGVPS